MRLHKEVWEVYVCTAVSWKRFLNHLRFFSRIDTTAVIAICIKVNKKKENFMFQKLINVNHLF